jgi:hypothetical protein
MSVGRNSRLERVTVNFVPRTSRAYRLGMQLSGDTATDVINRLVQEGAYLEWVSSLPGGELWSREPGEPWPARLRFSAGPPGDTVPVLSFSEALKRAAADWELAPDAATGGGDGDPPA